jgi:hypothetical protein
MLNGGKMLSTIKAALLGGTTSVISGGKFGNGAMTGAFSHAFNDLLHDKMKFYGGAATMIVAGAGTALCVVSVGCGALVAVAGVASFALSFNTTIEGSSGVNYLALELSDQLDIDKQRAETIVTAADLTLGVFAPGALAATAFRRFSDVGSMKNLLDFSLNKAMLVTSAATARGSRHSPGKEE